MRYTGFIGPSYQSQSIVASDDQTINWIPAKIESPNGAADYVFDPAPGFSYIGSSSGTGAIRAGSAALNNTAYIAIGTDAFGVEGLPGLFPTFHNLGTIGGSGAISIAPGPESIGQVMATNGSGDLYFLNVSLGSYIKISGVTGNTVAFLNGYFILLDPDTSTIYVSALEDGSSWDPLDFATRSDIGDLWKTMIVKQLEIWLFGSQSASVYFPDPNGGDFPFAPNLNVTITRGIRAVASLQLMQGSPIWLADDLTVRYAQGYTPVRVSNHAIEYLWSQYSKTSDAEAFVYSEQGHTFYVINFPTGNESWAYDMTTQLWHQRGPKNAGHFDMLPVSMGVQIPGTATNGANAPFLVGSRTDNKLYYYSQAYSTELDGTTQITRRRRAPNLVSELKRTRYANFQLFAEVGVITPTPTVTLQWSNDGGQSYNTGTSISAGALGDYSYRIRWPGSLGSGRNRSFQVTTASPLRLVDAFVDISVGAS